MNFAIYATKADGTREYLQAPDNTGEGHDYWRAGIGSHPGMLYSLDSNISLFPTEQAAKELIEVVLVDRVPRYTVFKRIGYHGVTENGNACRPFHERDFVKSSLNGCKSNPQLPEVVQWHKVTVGREGCLSRELMLRECDYILVTLVEEDMAKVKVALERMYLYKWAQITDIDKYPESVVIHFSAGLGGHTRHHSITIYSFNLDTAK